MLTLNDSFCSTEYNFASSSSGLPMQLVVLHITLKEWLS